MDPLITIQINQKAIDDYVLKEIDKQIKNIDSSKTFWDSSELKRQTCMSWNTIQDNFFHHPDFPKYKIGGKWYFPAKETEQFLLCWIKRCR